MFGNNAFGALAVESDSAAAGPSRVSVEGPEVDADWIKLVRTNHDAVVRVSDKVDLSGLPYECSLMAVSNIWDLLLVGSNTGLQVYRLSELHRLLEGAAKDASPAASPVQTIPLPARPIWVKLAMNDERLVVSMADGAGTSLWRLRDVLAGSTAPYHTFTSNVPSHLIDVLPNPSAVEPFNRYVTLLGKQGFVIADIEANTLSTSLAEQATCASWSAKGKQIAVGTPSGAIIQYTPEGSAKATIPPPPDLDSFAPTSVQWLENDLFLVSYASPDSPPDEPLEVYTIHRRGTDFTYTKFFDPLNTMGVAGRSGLFRFYAGLKAWGERTKHLIALASGLASEVALMHGSLAPEGNGPSWEVLILEETARGVLPAAKPGQSDDTSVIGLALDLTSDRSIKRGIVSGIEQPDLAPAPRLLVFSQDGVIISFDVQYPDAGPYPGMIRPQDISSAPPQMEVSMEDTTTGPTPVSAFGGFGQSNATTTPSKPPATGFSGFGQTSTPAFGSPSTPSAFGGSTFGSSITPTSNNTKPAFGSSAFGQASTPLAFGQSTFGKSSTPTASPVPPTALGQSAFGQPAKPAQANPSAFAAATSSPSAFGASTSTSLGFGAFGSAKPASGTAPTFGTSAFGSTAPSSAVNQTSAFGSSNSKGAFGSGSAFGTGAFGAPPSETTNSAFSGFGSGTTSTPSGFSGFGPKATEPPKAAFTGFGQAAKSTSPSHAPENDFGLGGFASALEPSAKLPNNGQGDSPPDSPVFGAAKQLHVSDDDDSPPASPVPATTPTTKPTTSSSVSSSFIKPATAFSGVVSGGFGAFGQTSTSQSRATTGTAPAFASPALPTTSAYGSTAFGTPSTGGATGFGQSSKPVGFGTGFGQSSKPVGFGTPSTPAAPSAFGNISGGFGGFAAKASAPSSEKATASGFGGFGGFASKSTATSVFGGAENASPAKSEKSIFETPENVAAKSRTTSAFSATKPTAQADKVPSTTIKEQVVSPAVIPEKATLPAGYDVPSTDAKSSTQKTSVAETKPEPAPAPPGYDVPAPPSPPADTPASSSGDAAPVEATIVPIPDEPVVEEPDSDQEVQNVGGTAEEADWEEVDDDEEREENVVEPEEEEEDYEEEEDEEEYDDEEDEEEDEEQEDGPIRRRSSSIMSPIKEESSEELESEDAAGEYDDEAESGDEGKNDGRESSSPVESSKTPKSPPAWFAKSPQPVSISQPVPTPSEPSLLSRLGPAPTPAPPTSQPIVAGHSIPANFINKHAVRASSPLGQPPETAQNSTTPPVSPAPPTSKETPAFSLFPPRQKEPAPKDPAETSAAFNLFGQKSNNAETTTSSAASTPAFSLFGQAQKTEPAASPATNSGGFSLFPPRPPAAPAPNSLFDAQPAASPTPLFGSKPSSSAEPAKPTFGLGLGKPPAPAKPPADLASSSASQSRGPSATSTFSVQPPKPSIPLGQPRGKPQPVPTTFTVPARQPPPALQRPSAPATKTIAATLEQMIQTVQAELVRLKATLEVNAQYHQSVAVPGFAKIDRTNLSKHKALPLSTISDLLALVEDVFSELDRVRESDGEVELKMAELQSRMLKNDMKIGQIEKFIEAREDPSFVQAMQVKELSSEQSEMQVQLRHAMQATESQLEELETALAVFKRDTSSDSSKKANGDPVVERIQRSVRAVDTALQERLQTIDELSRRIDAIRVSTPTKTRPISTGHLGTPSRKPPTSVSFNPPPEVLREIHLQVSAEGCKPAWLAGMKVARLSRPGSNEKKASIPASLASGPVKINSLHPPGQLPKGVQASVKAELRPNESQDGSEAEEKPSIPPSTPEETKPKSSPPSSIPTAESPSFGFGGIKISLDPGQVVTSATSRTSRPGGGSHRAHVPAAQLRQTSGSGTPSSPTAGFSFNLPAESPKETKKGTPSGFFSLSGFDQK